MNKYKVLIYTILVLLFILILLFLFKDKVIRKDTIVKNTEEVEALVNISQSEISSFLFSTQESENDHRLHINLTPFLNIEVVNQPIKNFYIQNFKGENKLGTVVLIHPTNLSTQTLSRTFLFTESSESILTEDIKESGDSIEYEVVDTVENFSQVSRYGNITPYFSMIVRDIGTLDYKNILERDGTFDGLKYLEYSGIDPLQLNTSIQFEVKMEFNNGDIYVKKFKGFLDGSKLQSEISPLFTLEVVD